MPLAREQRRLAAILFADAVGSSRLMGRDERGTVARLLEHLNRRLAPAAARHGGRVIRLKGDGALVEFTSAVDAVTAAIEFQQAMAEASVGQPEDKAILFRIGLHLGDVIVEGNDIYGDDVNVAARLEAEAPPGGIVVSRAVREAVQGRLKASLHAMGELALKNIDRPIRAFRVEWTVEDWPVSSVASGALASPMDLAPALTLPDKPSIAVLPFQNISSDPEQEYFVDGLVEDIITALSRFKSLFVIARNSSFTYKGKAVDIKQVGRELGVRYILEGSVRKAGDRLRISGQLIGSTTGSHIWAERYDGELAQIFDLQDRVTTDVVGAITPKVEQAEIDRVRRNPTTSLNAYDHYLRGMAFLPPSNLDASIEAHRIMLRSIALDPEYALPHAMAAFCVTDYKGFGATVDPGLILETSTLARRAVELDRGDALVLTNAAWALAQIAKNLDEALGLAEEALILNPNLAFAWFVGGYLYVFAGRHDAAHERFDRAMRLNPLDHINRHLTLIGAAHAHYMMTRYDEALGLATKAILVRQFPPAIRIGLASAAKAGDHKRAATLLPLYRKVDPARRVSNLEEVLGPYRRPEDVENYRDGLRMAGLPE
jgi:TolB-like protein/class 3 adenylate cyclase/tetratricopeptide (TPR) repeat protein